MLALSIASGATASLYQRLGGRERIRPAVGNYVDMVMSDPRLRMNSDASKFFDRAKPADLKPLLYEVVCEASHGPCKAVLARSALKNALEAMQLTDSDWQALMDDFSAVLVKFKISAEDQRDLRRLMDKARLSTVPGAD